MAIFYDKESAIKQNLSHFSPIPESEKAKFLRREKWVKFLNVTFTFRWRSSKHFRALLVPLHRILICAKASQPKAQICLVGKMVPSAMTTIIATRRQRWRTMKPRVIKSKIAAKARNRCWSLAAKQMEIRVVKAPATEKARKKQCSITTQTVKNFAAQKLIGHQFTSVRCSLFVALFNSASICRPFGLICKLWVTFLVMS